MVFVVREDNESFDRMLNRFKRQLSDAGVSREFKRGSRFTSKGESRRRKVMHATRLRRRREAETPRAWDA